MSPCTEYAEVRHRPQFLFSALLTCSLAAPATTLTADTQVFTDRHYAIEAHAGMRVVELDAPARIESELASSLPADQAQAATIVQQRLQDGGAELQRRLTNAYQGVTDAWSLGITKIPAVVVDQRYVIYGERDVTRALARIEEYRRTEP